jgi:peptide/nickel transport system permease protein
LRPMALLTRLTRASMVETLRQEFIRTAIAKGVPPFRLVTKYALRNAILPVITAIGTTFGFLLTGSFVVERFFLLPGVGSTTIEAILRNDPPVIMACVLVTGIMFVIINTIVDALLPLLDPRIREAQV